jgi:excisionase family DNA binding protein
MVADNEVRAARTGDKTDIAGALLDYAAAAHYLCTTPRHVRELWARRYLAAVKVGRCVRFSRSDLDSFIAANRVSARR